MATDHLLKHLQGAKSVLVGGAALSAGVRNQATAGGIKVVTTYGMSETSGGRVYNGETLDRREYGKLVAAPSLFAARSWHSNSQI